jgi:hypothetical protein
MNLGTKRHLAVINDTAAGDSTGTCSTRCEAVPAG